MILNIFLTAALGAAASVDAAKPAARYAMYFDQYHTAALPNKTITAGITHVITAFANSSLFASDPPGVYTPFKPLTEVRALFEEDVKCCMSVGGWGDTTGLGLGSKNDTTRRLFASNVAATLDRLGYDCVDIDWEYPGGNGADYKQIPNSKKKGEIAAYPKLLREIKKAIGTKELAITVPGLERDMIAFTAKECPLINRAVDFVTIMAYDMMNRRDVVTKHHTPVHGSLEIIDRYISLGFSPRKLNLGFALYAKWFTTAPGVDCSQGLGCKTALLENPDGSDAGASGAMTFEAANFQPVPANLTVAPDASCGVGTFHKCGDNKCCSQYGFCGDTPAHCGTGCQADYGQCNGTSTLESFHKALANSKTDEVQGGQWYWDSKGPFFWSFETADLIKQKFRDIVMARGLGGVAAWSLGEDSHDFALIKAIQSGVKDLSGDSGKKSHVARHQRRAAYQ